MTINKIITMATINTDIVESGPLTNILLRDVIEQHNCYLYTKLHSFVF